MPVARQSGHLERRRAENGNSACEAEACREPWSSESTQNAAARKGAFGEASGSQNKGLKITSLTWHVGFGLQLNAGFARPGCSSVE